MRWSLVGLAIAIALAFTAILSSLRRTRRPHNSPVSAKPLLSRPEQILYGRLVRAFPEHIILAQVALSQVLTVNRRDSHGSAHSIANQFRQLVADFVVCAPDFTAVAVIELDDRSHQRNVQRERDQRKDRFLRGAGIKVIRVATTDIPNETDLRALVMVVPIALPQSNISRYA